MPAIENRLARQLASRGVKGARGMAIALLKKNGILNAKGGLTAKGRVRNAMSPAARAKDRAAKASGKSPSAYNYSSKTNRATLKKK